MATAGKTMTLQFQKLSLQRDDLEKKLAKQQKRILDADREIAEYSVRVHELKIAKRGQGGAQADRELTKRVDKEASSFSGHSSRVLCGA